MDVYAVGKCVHASLHRNVREMYVPKNYFPHK